MLRAPRRTAATATAERGRVATCTASVPSILPLPLRAYSFSSRFALPFRIFSLSSGLTGNSCIHCTPGGLITNG